MRARACRPCARAPAARSRCTRPPPPAHARCPLAAPSHPPRRSPQIKRARDLRTTAGGAGPFWAYAVARLGAVRHRTHVIESSSSPEWNEKVVFDARSVQAGGSVATFEIWTQGYLTDDLVGGRRARRGRGPSEAAGGDRGWSRICRGGERARVGTRFAQRGLGSTQWLSRHGPGFWRADLLCEAVRSSGPSSRAKQPEACLSSPGSGRPTPAAVQGVSGPRPAGPRSQR